MDQIITDRYQAARGPEDLPWFRPDCDPDLLEVFDLFVRPGMRVADLGAGPARHAIELASRGCDVTCVDGVEKAKEFALELAKEHGVELTYKVGDILKWFPPYDFDLVFDRGCMHLMGPEDRQRWRRRVLDLLKPGGFLIVKVLDPIPKRTWGPTGLSERALVELIGGEGLSIVELKRSRFQREEPHICHTLVAQRV